MIQLIVSQLALGAGPFIYGWLRRNKPLLRLLDWFVVISISALVTVEIVPEAVREVGFLVLLAVAAGMLAPTLLEQLLHQTESHALENWTHRVTLIAGISGLALHATLDGAGLATATGDNGNTSMLAAAIMIHRFPVGLSIWWLLRPKFGKRIATLTLIAMAVATFGGYGAGGHLLNDLPTAALSWFQTFVAGSLLHVVFFRKHLEHE